MELKKGVSPVIATILLVALVVTAALIVYLWIRSNSHEVITKFGDENIELACKDVSFEADYSSGTLSISNTGTVHIYDINIEKYNADGYETISLKEESSSWDTGLTPGEGFSESISLDSYDKLILIPVLVGNSESGKKTFVCEGEEYEILIS